MSVHMDLPCLFVVSYTMRLPFPFLCVFFVMLNQLQIEQSEKSFSLAIDVA